MKTPIALALLAILAFATSPAAAAERACRPSLSNGYHCPDASAPAKRPTQPTRTSGRACQPSLSNLWTCPDTSQPRPRTTSTDRASADRPCRPASRTAIRARSLLPMVEGPPHQRRSADVGRACRMDTTARAEDRPAPTNIRRKRWHGCIAPPTPSSGQTPGRVSTTSATLPITAAQKPGRICVSRPRAPKAYARRRMKSIPEPREEQRQSA